MRSSPTASTASRRGVTRVEFVVFGSLICLWAALVVPFVWEGREFSRNKQCSANLRRIGMALHNYHDANGMFPAGAQSWSKFPNLQVSANVTLIYFFDFGMVWRPPIREWHQDDPSRVSRFDPVHSCPSNGVQTTTDPFLGSMRKPPGGVFGVGSYLYCKGAGDAWCNDPTSIPAHLRGAFDVDVWNTLDDMTDGTSQTIFVGEGATGSSWGICSAVGCTEPLRNPATGSWSVRHQPWAVPFINTDGDLKRAGPRASQFGSTLEPLNKDPVTDTMIDCTALTDCRSSTDGGPHRTSNFRSNHKGGANFLFADGAVRFVSEDIEMPLYRGLSTIGGGENVVADTPPATNPF